MEEIIFEWEDKENILFNPVQEKLFEDRATKDIYELKEELEKHFRRTERYFRGDRVLTVRRGDEDNPKEKGKFVILEGTRRFAASNLIEGIAKVPVYVEDTIHTYDARCILRIVQRLELEGYTQPDIAMVVEEWIQQDADEATIQKEFLSPALLAKYLAYPYLPNDIQEKVRATNSLFTKAANIAVRVFRKINKKPKFELYEGMTQLEADAILRDAFNYINTEKAVTLLLN